MLSFSFAFSAVTICEALKYDGCDGWISLKPEIEVGAVDVVEVEDVDGFLEIARLLLTLLELGAKPFDIAEGVLLAMLEVPWVVG